MIILDIFQAVFSFCDHVQDLFYGNIDKVNIRLYNTGAAIALKKLKAAFISKFFLSVPLCFISYVCVHIIEVLIFKKNIPIVRETCHSVWHCCKSQHRKTSCPGAEIPMHEVWYRDTQSVQ